jgi:hypothetical protein
LSATWLGALVASDGSSSATGICTNPESDSSNPAPAGL